MENDNDFQEDEADVQDKPPRKSKSWAAPQVSHFLKRLLVSVPVSLFMPNVCFLPSLCQSVIVALASSVPLNLTSSCLVLAKLSSSIFFLSVCHSVSASPVLVNLSSSFLL